MNRVDLTKKQESDFYRFTNAYIENLRTLCPVLAYHTKHACVDMFGDSDYNTFEGTVVELESNLDERLKLHTATGFSKEMPVSNRLSNWLNIESTTLLTGPQLTKLVWEKLKEKNLYYEQDKRVFRVDEESSKLFELDMENVNISTSHKDTTGFNFCNLQTAIARANKTETVYNVYK
jgi:hypothetical protein